MRSTVSIAFGPAEVLVTLPAGEPPWSSDDARRWLDEQFTANGCEPFRPTGKVLTADKLLAIASAVGQRGFEQDEALRVAFAHAATAALSRPVVRIDVDGRAVSY
jgi:hypothetical protein